MKKPKQKQIEPDKRPSKGLAVFPNS